MNFNIKWLLYKSNSNQIDEILVFLFRSDYILEVY